MDFSKALDPILRQVNMGCIKFREPTKSGSFYPNIAALKFKHSLAYMHQINTNMGVKIDSINSYPNIGHGGWLSYLVGFQKHVSWALNLQRALYTHVEEVFIFYRRLILRRG